MLPMLCTSQDLFVWKLCAGSTGVSQAGVVAPGKVGQESTRPPVEGSREHLPCDTEAAPVSHGLCLLCLKAYGTFIGWQFARSCISVKQLPVTCAERECMKQVHAGCV